MNSKYLLYKKLNALRLEVDSSIVDDIVSTVDDLFGQQNGAKPIVKCRLYEVKYHSSYAAWNHQTASFLANTEAEALDKFWANKNKESYEVMSVCLVNGT